MLKSFEELKQKGFDFQEFERIRQQMILKSKKALKMSAIVGGSIALLGIIFLIVGAVGIGIGAIVAGLLVFGIWYAIVNSNAKSELKSNLLNNMLVKIDDSFSYEQSDTSLSKSFRNSGFERNISEVQVEDVFKGQIAGMNFTLGEVTVSRKDSENSSVTIFKGPFCCVETSNSYAFTSIIPDRLEKAFGGLGRIMQKANISRLNQKLIKIDEDGDFEKYFAVWTKDEQSIREILNPQFRDYLKGIASMTKVYVGFKGNFIYFGMNNRKDLFRIKLKEQITESTMKRFYDEFSDYYKILENVVLFATTGTGTETGALNRDDAPPPPPPTSSF